MWQPASGWTRPRMSPFTMRSPDDVAAAWEALHRALPAGWVTSPPVYQQETRTWATHAHDSRRPRPLTGSRVEAFGADLPSALRELAARLRALEPRPGPERIADRPRRTYGHLRVVG